MNKHQENKIMRDILLYDRMERTIRNKPIYDRESASIVAWGYLALFSVITLSGWLISAFAMGVFE